MLPRRAVGSNLIDGSHDCRQRPIKLLLLLLPCRSEGGGREREGIRRFIERSDRLRYFNLAGIASGICVSLRVEALVKRRGSLPEGVKLVLFTAWEIP
jgi:hypothetical protein